MTYYYIKCTGIHIYGETIIIIINIKRNKNNTKFSLTIQATTFDRGIYSSRLKAVHQQCEYGCCVLYIMNDLLFDISIYDLI